MHSILLPSVTRKNTYLLVPGEIHEGGSDAVTTALLPTPITRMSSRVQQHTPEDQDDIADNININVNYEQDGLINMLQPNS